MEEIAKVEKSPQSQTQEREKKEKERMNGRKKKE